jgi:hypothetical protein
MNQSQFRVLVVTAPVLSSASSFIDRSGPALLSPVLLEAERHVLAAHSSTTSALFLLALVASSLAMLVAIYGLLSFKSWSRWFSVAATVGVAAVIAVIGGVAFSGVGLVLALASWFCWGAAVSLSFAKPCSDWFEFHERRASVVA